MDAAKMRAIVAEMQPHEIWDALWFVALLQRWGRPTEETAEWRRRISERQAMLRLAASQRQLSVIDADRSLVCS